jgi:hypothetical protein
MRHAMALSGAVIVPLLLAVPTSVETLTAQAREASTQGSSPAVTRAEKHDPTTPQPAATPARVMLAGAFLGYGNGLAFQAFLQAQDFAQGFPLSARLRLGIAAVEPGSPPDARRVFINDATNGTPRERGRTLDLGLDGLYPWGAHAHLYGGIRHTRFKANFRFVGGNEDFDVSSHHWGLALGMEAAYSMGARTSLLVSAAGEYFFPARLYGHDTSYSPDGDHVNPRKDYGYHEADRAVDQPRLRPLLLMGIRYRLGQ